MDREGASLGTEVPVERLSASIEFGLSPVEAMQRKADLPKCLPTILDRIHTMGRAQAAQWYSPLR